jgi:type I restriction enzyme S subunit
MSGLNFLERLLDGVTVEWKMLEDVASFRRGSFPQPYGNSEWYDGEGSLPFVQVVDVLDGKFELKENTKQRISKLAQPKSVFVEEGTVIVTLQGTIGRVAVTQYDCYVDRTLAIFTNYISGINKKYFAYQLKSKFDIEKENARGSTLKTITKEEFSKFEIPIPCPDNPDRSLAIQAEIVRILDTFTALTAELTAELSDRQKQYNYYRDRLLTFEEGEAEYKTLGEIGEFTYGYSAKAQDSGDTRFVRITDININGKLIETDLKYVDISSENERYLLKKNDLLMARTGATYGKTMIFEEDYPAIYAGFLIKLSFDESVIIPKFYWHFAQSNFFWDQANRLVSGGGQPQFNANVLKDVKMLIPPLEEQARIVAILDKFDIITNSIREGLPREIALRQQQYEYYRDLLLSFPKPEEVKA